MCAKSDLTSSIKEQLKAFSDSSDESLYYVLSSYTVAQFKDSVTKEALNSLPPDLREKAKLEMGTGAGLYGPISFLLGKVDTDRNQLLLDAANLSPTVKDGVGQFESFWNRLKSHVCDDWHYCERRKQYADELTLWTAIAAIAVEKLSLEVSVATAVVLLAAHKGPKFICDCPD
jgi:hypothetical protein